MGCQRFDVSFSEKYDCRLQNKIQENHLLKLASAGFSVVQEEARQKAEQGHMKQIYPFILGHKYLRLPDVRFNQVAVYDEKDKQQLQITVSRIP